MKCSCIQNSLLSEVVVQLHANNTKSVMEQIQAKEKIDAFICAIGYYGTKTLSEFDIKDYENALMVNVTVPLLSAIEIAKIFTCQNAGKMIFISSAAAYVGSRDVAYSLSKAAINGIVHGLAKNFENYSLYMSGAVFPIWVFPVSMQSISKYLPFQYIYYEPITLMTTGYNGKQIMTLLFTQLLWMVGLFALSTLLWKKSIRKITIQGG